MAINEELRPSKRPAFAGHATLLPLVGLAALAAAVCFLVAGRHAGHEAHIPAPFLVGALGEERAEPPAPVRTGTATARIDGGRLVVEGRRQERVGLSARTAGGTRWTRHAGGAWRATPFGSEAIMLGTDDPEHFLTVDRRVGRRTWAWRLETRLTPRLLPDGGVGFVDPATHRVADLTIAPVVIFDSAGDDVTPAGLRWQLGKGKTLELDLRDDDLPEPFVIDPAFRSIGAVAAGTTTTVAPAVPAGVLAGDQLVAFVSSTAATATLDVAPPAGWTLVRAEASTTFVKLWTFVKQATGSEPATYTFTFQDPTGADVSKTSRAIVAAYSGIKSSAPIDGSYGNNSAGLNNQTANVPGVSTAGTNRISIWTVANNSTRTAANPTINGLATTEQIDSTAALPSLELADAAEPTAFGPVAVGTGNVLSNNARWAAQVFSLIPDTTAPTQTLAVTEGTNPGGQFFNSGTNTHYYNTGAGGDFTVTSTPTDADSGVTSVAFAAVALTGFTHTTVTDTTSPYNSNTYTWTNTNTTSPGANQTTVTDRNANTVQGLTITRDATAPTVFTLNAPAGGAFIKNGSTVSVTSSNPTDAGAGVGDVSFRACPGSNGCTWTDGDAFAVGTDTTDQYATTWPAGQADGAYQVIARATDNVGNVRDTASPVNVTLDNTNPSQTLALNSVSQSGGLDQAFKNGTTVYYRGTTAGSFKVRSSVTDGGSGPASATFAALGGTSTGWTFSGSTSTTPGAGTYDSNTYSWGGSTTSSPTAGVTPTDAVGNSPAATTLTFTDDSTAPSHAFTFPAAGGSYNTAGWGGSITGTASDGGADLLRVEIAIQQGSGNYYDGSSFANGSLTWLTATGTTSWSYALAAAKLTSGNVYTVSLRAIDNVGNTASTITRTFTYDTTAPTFGTLAIGAPTNASITGTTVYYRSGFAGTFTLSQQLSDPGGSGAASVQFPAIATAGWTHGNETANGASPYASSTFSWSASPSTPIGYTLTGADAAGNTATQGVSFVADATAPTGGALTVNGTAATGGGTTSTSSGGFTISRSDYTDGGSGLGSSMLTRDSAPFANDACGTFSGSPTTIGGAPAQSLGTGCYEYVLTGTDAVGNTTSIRTVVQVHGASTQITVAGSTANLTSGATRLLTATLRDAAGNTVLSDSSTAIAFAKQLGVGTVSGTGNATVSNGVATKTVTGQLAGSVTMEATAPGLTTGTFGAFSVVHGAATQIALTGSTADLASGATRVLTATIQDAAGNTVTSDNTTVVAFAQQSGAGSVSGTGNATASGGVATKTFTGQVVGAVTMEVTAGGLATGTLGAFDVVAGAPAQIALSGSTVDLTSGATRLLTATIRDAAGNMVTSDNTTVIAFAKQSGIGTISGSGNATASSGVATKTITGVLAGPVAMEATAAGLSTGTLGAFDVVHGAAADIILTGSTADLASGATRMLTATIEDAAGNTVTSDDTTVIAFARASGTGTVSGTGTANAASGVATKTITGALAGSVAMDATASGLTTGTLGAFNVVPGVATQIALTGSTANLTSGTTRVLTATVEDAAGNTVTSDNSTVITFAQASGAGTVSGTGNSTASGGIATKTITGALTGTVTIEATATGLATGTLGAFTVVPGVATQIALTGSTANLASGTTRLLTATVEDAAGNTVTSDNSTVVAFAQASGAGTVSGTGNASASNGVATMTISGQLAGPVTIEATAAGLTSGSLGALTVVHGAAADIALTGSTADLTSGANRVLTATITDAAGNTVSSDNTTVIALAKQSGTGTVGGTGNATVSSGVATKTITGQLAGPVTIEATAAGLTTGTLGSFDVVHGAATQIALSGTTATLASSTARLLTATIEDAAGNTVTSDNATVVAFAQQSGAGTVSGSGNATASGGVATKTITGQLAGPVTMEATSAGLTSGTLGPFSVVHGASADILLTGSTADLASGASRVLTATIRDAAGNTVTSDNTTVIGFAKASGAGTVSGTGNATASAGVATKTVTGALAGALTMEATAAGLTTGALGAFTVVPGAATQIALSGSTADLASGATRILTATIQDAAGNTVTADNSTVVAFAQASGTGSVTGAGNATASGGVATKTITGALAGTVSMNATAAGLTTGTLGSFSVIAGPAAQIALTGSTADLSSGTMRLLTATILDAAGNTVTSDNSTVITFAKQSGVGTVTDAGDATVSAGVATKTIAGQLAGPITIEATAAGLTTGTLAVFNVVHGAATRIQLSDSGSAASGDNHTLTATIEDAAGNTVASDNTTSVAFAKTGGVGTATGLGSATASSGIATRVVVNAVTGQIDLDAQAAGLTAGGTSYTIVAGNASTLTSTITASPTSIVANGSSTSTITVRLKDAAGNDLAGSGGAVTLGLTGTGSLSAVTDNGDGTYSATLTSPTLVGGATVTGTLNAVALAATAAATYVHGTATQIVLTESGSNVAGNGHTLTATIEDANGNTVTGDSSSVVTFAKTGGAGTVTGLGDATASNGVATTTLTNRLAGQIDLGAQRAGLATGTASYTITTGPVSPAASDSTVVAAPSTVYANGSDAATITVTLRDAGGNGIAGKTVTLAQGSGGSSISGGGSTNASGVSTFSTTNTAVETVTYTATDTTDSITLADDATVDFTFADGTAPTNTVTLGSATRAWLTGSTLYYNGAAGGSFILSSAVADGGSGPASASYPAASQPGWAHSAETVSTPAGGPYVSSAISFNAGSTGNFTYDVTASDAWTPPNSSVTTLNMTEDSTAPAASILCDGSACSAGWYTASPVSVELAAPDAGAGLDQTRYTTDGTDPTILSGTAYAGAFTVAAEGATTVKYRSFDRIGNDTGVLAQTVRIDTVAPDTAIESTPAAATPDTTPTFTFSSPEPGTTFQARVDGGSWTTAASPLTLGPLAESTYTLEVRAIDAAGNVEMTPASFTFTIDTTPANTTITSSPAANSNATSVSFSFTASDAGPGFECRLDGGAFADCTSPKSYAGLTEAAHTFEVRAEDAAGNVDATPATHAWTVDLTAPETSLAPTPSNPSSNATPTFGLGSTESPATFDCDLDGGGWMPCTTPFTTPSLGDGSHTLRARATDAAANTDASEVTFTWLVDATAPTGSVIAPANGAAVGGTVVLASDSADTGSGVATVVFQRSPAAAGTWTGQAASWDTTAQADGDYDLRVVTTDNAGNSLTSAAITVTIDNTDPSLSIVAPNPVNLATADPAIVSATAGDAGSGIANVRFDQCAEDSPTCVSDSWVLLGIDTGAPYQASWPIPSDGPRLLRVRATDNAGKQTTELVLITIDRIRPSGSLTAPAAAANLRGAAVALAATAADTAPGSVNTVTFQRSPAGAGTWTDVSTDSSPPYAGTLDTTGLADGLYDLRVFTTDAAGNAEAAPATIQVRVDNTAPTGAVTVPASGASVGGTIALTSSSADTGSGVATVQFQRSPAGAGSWTNQAASFDTTTVADGLYDLRVTTTDNAGNAFISTALTVRVDNTLPTGAVTAPAAGANVRGTIALTSSSADTGSGVATVVYQRSPAGTGTWTNQPAGFDTTAVADGLYDLCVTTTDNAGNSFTSAAIALRVDNTLPTGAVTAPANGAEIGVPPIVLTSNSVDAGGSGVASVVFERSPAGAGTWSVTAASWDTASGPDAVTDGSYDLRVTTTDNAGNVFISPAVTVLVDHTAPATTASLAPGSPSNAPVTVSFSANDGAGSGVSTVSYRVDGGSLLLGAAVIVPAPGDHSNDGSHLVEYFATDDVGNVETLKSITVVIDTTAPSGAGGDPGTYLRGIANLTYSTVAGDVSSVQFQFSPAGAGAWSNIGGADISPPYEASWNTALVADGPYDLRAVVTDTTGNVANTLLPGLPKTVDNTAPAGSVSAPAGGTYVSGAIAVDASASDGAAPPASGVSAVRFEVKPAGAGAYSVFGTQTAPVVGSTYRQTLGTTALADGLAELRVVVTDVAGNETTSAMSTVNVDNDAPVVTLDDPGAAVGASVNLSASSSADTIDVTFRYRPVGTLGAGTAIGSDATGPFAVTWTTAPAGEQQWELIAVATDGGGNVTTSAQRVVLVDRTQPTGSVTGPTAGTNVGGPAVALAATAADTAGSGVALVQWQVKEFGAAGFGTVASDTTAPYAGTWNSTAAPDGATDIRATITDAAGNVHTTAVVSVTVDSTGPSVTLADPGAVVSGTVSLTATTGGGAGRVQFAVSPANAGTWTQIAEDTAAPFGTAFDTTALADGLYDLRAIGFDGLGNASPASIREDVRLDNTAPQLVSAAPADGSVSASASQIVLTASEPVTAPGVLLDGGAAPAPAVSGNQLTFPTGLLADGLHVLAGELEDASGTRIPFRVAVTIESSVGADRPPVELSARPAGASTLVAPGSLAAATVTGAAWPSRPSPTDFIVLHVDLAPPAPVLGAGLLAGTQLVEVTARWALAGTPVTNFAAPIEILIPNPSGEPTLPATSQDGTTWRALELLQSASLPSGQEDGWYRDDDGNIHILTRHLTWYALARDGEAPAEPRDLAGVLADDGLTLRWIPGTDASGQIGNILLYVNGEFYREFGPTEFEAKLGPFAAGDTRSFTLAQKDAAGNISRQTAPLRAVPVLAGKSLLEATAALGAAGFTLGTVTEAAAAVPPGTVVEPSTTRFALAPSAVDLVVARNTTAPQTRLSFSVAGSKRIKLKKTTATAIAVRIKVSKRAQVTATLRGAKNRRLHTWTLRVNAGANAVKLRLPAKIRPGAYKLTWVARSGTETIRRTIRFVLVARR